MACETTRDWLLQAELPAELKSAPANVASHLGTCTACQALIQQIQNLECVLRDETLPASAHDCRDLFLAREAVSPRLPARTASRGFVSARWIVAACLLLAVGIAGVFLTTPRSAQANDEVIEKLIDWNLDLSELPTPAEREVFFESRIEALNTEVARAGLSPEDRAFAHTLLETGKWLRTNAEPLDMADRFHTLADHVVERVQKSASRRDVRATQRQAGQYERITAKGIDAKLAKVKLAADEETRQKKAMEKLAAREAKRLERLQTVHENTPDPARHEIRKMIDQPKQKKQQPTKSPKL